MPAALILVYNVLCLMVYGLPARAMMNATPAPVERFLLWSFFLSEGESFRFHCIVGRRIDRVVHGRRC